MAPTVSWSSVNQRPRAPLSSDFDPLAPAPPLPTWLPALLNVRCYRRLAAAHCTLSLTPVSPRHSPSRPNECPYAPAASSEPQDLAHRLLIRREELPPPPLHRRVRPTLPLALAARAPRSALIHVLHRLVPLAPTASIWPRRRRQQPSVSTCACSRDGPAAWWREG